MGINKKIVTYCSNCRHEIKIKVIAKNRFELSKSVGKSMKLKCLSCGETASYDLNRVKAKTSMLVNLAFPIAIILSVVAVILLWDKGTEVYSYQLIPIVLIMINLIATVITFSSQQGVRYFNSYRV